MRRTPAALLLVAVGLVSIGCSIKRMAINSLADTLAESSGVFASDDDPELVRDAVPFSLKTIETLLESAPDHQGLLLSACSGFTQYSFAFVQTDAELIEQTDYEASAAGKDRARRLYLRARDYCLRAFDLRYRDIRSRLQKDAAAALAATRREEVPVLYWTAASWGLAIAQSLDRPEMIADFPTVRSIAQRALTLDEAFNRGAIHELMISVESVPALMGGSVERARKHFARALELTNGLSAGAYLSLANGIALPAQDRDEFEKLLKQALAVDIDKDKSMRLANIIAQRRARHMLTRIKELFAAAANPSACGPSRACEPRLVSFTPSYTGGRGARR